MELIYILMEETDNKWVTVYNMPPGDYYGDK